MKQSTLDRIRGMNKRFTNKVMIRLAGKKLGHFAVLTHTGRKTGSQYRIPIIAEPFEDGFVIALTYGTHVDWYANVLAQGGCGLRWKEHDYSLVRPALIDPEAGLQAFPSMLRGGLRAMGIREYLKLEIQR